MRLHRVRNAGFSLVEVMLAIAVMAVVFAAALPAAGGWFQTARLRATLTTATALAEAVGQYRMTNGAWPTAWSQLQGRYVASATPTTAWGDAFTVSAGANTATVTAPIPLGSVPSGLISPIATLTTTETGMQLTVQVLIPESAADLAWERNRVSGSTGF